MKHLRLSLAAGALVLVFTIPAFAGYMDTMVASPDGTPSRASALNPVAEIALNLAQSVLSLF
jgi:hypothetical protein